MRPKEQCQESEGPGLNEYFDIVTGGQTLGRRKESPQGYVRGELEVLII